MFCIYCIVRNMILFLKHITYYHIHNLYYVFLKIHIRLLLWMYYQKVHILYFVIHWYVLLKKCGTLLYIKMIF